MTYFPNNFPSDAPSNRHLPPERLARSGGGLRHGCGWYLGVLLIGFVALVLVLYAALVHSLHDQFQANNSPDAATPATSAQVLALDKHAMATDAAALAQMAQGDAWLTPGPTSVLDMCWISPTDSSRRSWNPLACARTTTQAFAFSGDFAQQVTAWAAQLTAAGWNTNSSLTGVLNGYRSLQQHQAQRAAITQPPASVPPTPTPTPTPMPMPMPMPTAITPPVQLLLALPPLTGCRTTSPSAHNGDNCVERFTINWAVKGAGVAQLHFDQLAHQGSAQYVRTSTFMNWVTTQTTLLASHDFVAIITYTDTYDDSYSAAAPSPTAAVTPPAS